METRSRPIYHILRFNVNFFFILVHCYRFKYKTSDLFSCLFITNIMYSCILYLIPRIAAMQSRHLLVDISSINCVLACVFQ